MYKSSEFLLKFGITFVVVGGGVEFKSKLTRLCSAIPESIFMNNP